MADWRDHLPAVRGKLLLDQPLAPYTWFRVGGPADALFLPADEDDLADFLKALPEKVPVTFLGMGSNTIVRDGGIEGVTIRLMGGYWGAVEAAGSNSLFARAGALDLSVAKAAAKEGIAGLSFFSGIPGCVGGAVRTNAGCYGRELKDVVNQIEGITRSGERVRFEAEIAQYGDPKIEFSYRHTNFPDDIIVTGILLTGSGEGDPDTLSREIAEHQKRRAETQPIKEKTGGSTFANPDPPGTPSQRSSWKLVEAAGCRGLRVGGAQVSEKHCNFLINTGEATAADIEALGELVRARVLDVTGVDLRWEIRRIGRLQARR
ncbi:UDP-N-acetylmuramate dehydrogenase [Henriciella pelagia]|uniref:UDP-N-acetylenolpyruvoylglucosamine reductase n=2 Tax=Henriciella pelagia TaxID=1977912 RepID=A0ABQ1JGN7_9PROT|nr:UDP-N-acetylmuramate dehydrogenase [Henriciella pelagia]GGB65936.1 UDP-N-acetylenolpyruvoylglucosamine reductase [Henriciella pelagia]